MGESQITRRRVLVGAGAAGALGPLLAVTPAFAKGSDKQVSLVRWDLVEVTKDGVILAGGTDVAKDKKSGDTISMTGTGQAEVHEEEASGGGTFVHRAGNGTERAHGTYLVTGFNSFTKRGGSLEGAPVKDAIGEIEDTSGGILSLKVHLTSSTGTVVDGVLIVNCDIGDSSILEGITFTADGHDFVQQSGATLFHLLAPDDE